MSSLSPLSYAVLGLLEMGGPCTPYELKARVAGSIGNFWPIAHSKLYAEPERLRGMGMTTAHEEAGGRRRKTYAVTDDGRAALREWTLDPRAGSGSLRSPALLALFLGADPAKLAATVLPVHRERLAAFEELLSQPSLPVGRAQGPRLALSAGVAYHRGQIEFWTGLLADGD